ncbi:hypothetical protein JVT61DRAFT_10451 [Boletus reticuloceps]|uniref:Uncharacterized protein n=1 Tax=Boletus reticuloceps TaxID=495285 RepID=A0A8I2YXM3_9AGAM|nr:hypothetical protein JVT61DRAFT_10451 [Boletus reticuloceps]
MIPKTDMWSSSYRRVGYVSDSDSDPDIDANAVAKPETNDTHLIREMDLAARHETVEYRPNPWRIARMNAASRPPPPNPAPVRTPAPARSSPRPQPKPIVEAFKKQVKRGTRGDLPVVRDGRAHLGDGPHTFATNFDAKPRQGCDNPQNRDLAQGRSRPQLLAAHKPQSGSTICEVEAFKSRKSTHISTIPGQPNAPRPFMPSGIKLGARSSLTPPIGDRTTPYHSSPGPRSHAHVSAHTMRPSLPPPGPALIVGMNSRPTKTNNAISAAGHGTPPKWLSVALDQGPPPVPPLLPEPRHFATGPPHTRTPEPKHKRLASPEPITPPRKTPRVLAPRPPTAPASASNRCPTAYAFGQDDDPDGDWSTLGRTRRKRGTPTKRAAKPKPSGMKQSGHFRLPLLGLVAPTPTRATEVRRVITYLPPPMASKKLVDDIDSGPRSSKAIIRAKADPLTKRVTAEARAAIEEEEEIEEILVMDSDMTLVNEDEDDVAQIDIDDVCKRYPTTQACMKAVRCRA